MARDRPVISRRRDRAVPRTTRPLPPPPPPQISGEAPESLSPSEILTKKRRYEEDTTSSFKDEGLLGEDFEDVTIEGDGNNAEADITRAVSSSTPISYLSMSLIRSLYGRPRLQNLKKPS
jgi:hypothetical protein